MEAKHGAGRIADYARSSLRSKKRELELALEGSFTENQGWLPGRELCQPEWLEMQVPVLEQEIERRVAGFEEPMRRLMTIPGVDRKTCWREKWESSSCRWIGCLTGNTLRGLSS